MDKIEINIGIFGAVSCGKSSLLNAITGQQYSDTEIKKTTMVPQAYLENINNKISNEDQHVNAQVIRKINRETNDYVSGEIDANIFNIEKCQSLYHNIDKICDLFDPSIIDSDLKINIYDIPGLNDSASKDIYFQWVKQNIKLFDIIIFMTDITRGLNNSDEIEILNLLMESMKLYKNKMICLINKCDDIYYDSEQNDLVFEDREQENIYIQANNILTDIAKSHSFDSKSDNFTPFLPISAENCFIYRTLVKNPSYELDQNHQNKLCKNECGVNQWKKMSTNEKEELFLLILRDLEKRNDNKILDTGYLAFKEIIQKIIVNNKLDFLMNHIENDVKDLEMPTIENITTYVDSINKYISKLTQIQTLGKNASYILFWKNINTTLNNYIINITKINTRVTNYGEFIRINEFDMLHSNMQGHCMNFKILKEAVSNIPEYPKEFFTVLETQLHDKLINIYENISSVKFIDQVHVCPTNIRRYLEIIKTYIPKQFEHFSIRFLKKFSEATCRHIISYPNEFIDLTSYVLKNIDRSINKGFNIYLIIVSKILINKLMQMQLKLQTKFPEQYFIYLIQMKKITKSFIKKLSSSETTPFDIFYEVVCKNISLYLGTNCVVSIYKQEMCHNKVASLLNKFYEEEHDWDVNFERNLLNVFTE